MALLDVSEVISDPLFTSEVIFISQSLSYDSNGNPVYEEDDDATVQAVVTQDKKAIERFESALQREGSIVVRVLADYLPEGFQGKGYDKLTWRDKSFLIVETADYTQFGRGFLRMLCVPEDADDGGY